MGKCNSTELYKIFEKIKPEIIFEELPPSCFDKYYITRTKSNLESDTINYYLQNYKIQHILVDSDDIPPEKFFSDYQKMFEKIEGRANQNGFNFRSLFDRNKSKILNYGFKYLNSKNCSNLYKEVNEIIFDELEKLNEDELHQINKLWNDNNEKRENKMLENIYAYSQKNSYGNAIFMIGAAHRISIIEKIKRLQEKSKIKLNWTFYE